MYSILRHRTVPEGAFVRYLVQQHINVVQAVLLELVGVAHHLRAGVDGEDLALRHLDRLVAAFVRLPVPEPRVEGVPEVREELADRLQAGDLELVRRLADHLQR